MNVVTIKSMLRPENPFIRLSPKDNVVVARVPLSAGATIQFEGREIHLQQAVGAGHKVAVQPIKADESVYKYGENIGRAGANVEPGDLVHVHNLRFDLADQKYEFATTLSDLAGIPRLEEDTFLGYQRPDGRAGTRNFIAIVGASNCAAFAAQQVEAAFSKESFAGTGIDGVVAFPHVDGCGQAEGPDIQQLRRTLDGLADHPNVAAAIVVGLGCEVNQVSYYLRPAGSSNGAPARRGFTLQESGGTTQVVSDSSKAVWELIEEVGKMERVACPVSKLVVALECGGSDAFSGITANPSVGYFSDLLVKQGGTVCLAETTEICGAEHLLTRRAVNREVGEKLLDKIEWYKRYVDGFGLGISFDSNPSPGNKAGGLTNIAEKSLGAVAKAGTSNLTAVYDFAERITSSGFVFMNTPGYDPTSVTGMAAGGCNVCLFTTGRGSAFGFPTIPVVKIASNSKTGLHMDEDMDVNCGTVAEGEEDIPGAGKRIHDFVLETASGRRTFSELLGHREFIPWRIGPVL
ncbi:MAG: altronate dehydratase family protein [Acidobacteria bacterium]|nr:altronate dehydratase family protein [Acidobacteriota bacterium]